MPRPRRTYCKPVSKKFLSRNTDSELRIIENQWHNKPRSGISNLPACMVCSVEIVDSEDAVDMDVESIPNRHMLTPEAHHPAHELHLGILLDMTAVEKQTDMCQGKICSTCLDDLQKGKTPVMALANGSWVGPVPPALQDLTIAEQTLIALHPHTTYHIDFHGEPSSPSCVVRKRTVHPMAAESDEPTTCLPATPDVLDGAFNISYPQGFCLNEAAFELLMVRRGKVLDALLWLKDHNDFYNNVTLSGERIRQLPTKGIIKTLLQDRASKNELFHNYHECKDRFCNYRRCELTHSRNSFCNALAKSTHKPNLRHSVHIWLMQCFPDLFCYGKGNLGRGVKNLSMLLQCGEALFRRQNPRFRKSLAFADAFFRIVQDTRLLEAAGSDLHRPVMESSNFRWSEIEVHDIIRAAEDEARGVDYSDERMSDIVRHATSLLKRLEGNVYSPARATDMMWGRIILWSLPSLLLSVTISEHNTLVIKTIAGPDAAPTFNRLNTQGTSDPKGGNALMLSRLLSSSAHACVDELLGFESDYDGVSRRDKGLFGRVQGHLGTVTSYEPGTITFHLVIWLLNAPTLNEMRNGLKSKGFRERVARYIASVCRGEPDSDTGEVERMLVDELQVHKCSPYCSGNRCKQHYARASSESITVDEDGSWQIARTSTRYDTYNPSITRTMQLQQRLHVFTNGPSTKREVGLLSRFVGAPRNPNVDISAPLSTALGDKCRDALMPGWMDEYTQSARLLGAILIAITRQNEIPTEIKGIQLMGCNEFSSSHPSKQLNWYMLKNTLMLTYSELAPPMTGVYRFPEMRLLRDYSIRGHELDGMNLFDFTLKTYERKGCRRPRANQVFVPYLEGSYKEGKGRLICPRAQVVVPELIGGWPPASDDGTKRDLYEASMLLLFNPWRDIKRLKDGHGSFTEAFMDFATNMSDEVRVQVENIQSFYECRPDGHDNVEGWETDFG